MTYTPEQLREEAFREFEQWFIANYPGPETIISDPAWHAPKIFRSATHRLDKAHADALEELARLRARLEIDFATDGNGKRVPFPTGGPDGIACRDETIRILESALAEAERKCARLRFHAEAMAKDLELSYEVGESSFGCLPSRVQGGMMDKKCCPRADVQATHWEGCHTRHPECAAYKAGREAGMREAAEICLKQADKTRHTEAWNDGCEGCNYAILAAIREGK